MLTEAEKYISLKHCIFVFCLIVECFYDKRHVKLKAVIIQNKNAQLCNFIKHKEKLALKSAKTKGYFSYHS